MIPIKSTDRTLTEMQDLEEMAAKLLETARKLPLGPVRHDILKEIGKFRVRITALKARENDRRQEKHRSRPVYR
jgi:hypothetical protein